MLLLLQRRLQQLASAIKAVGIKAGGRVGIYAPNVPNWMLVIQACNRSSLQVGMLAFDDTLPFPNLRQPLMHSCHDLKDGHVAHAMDLHCSCVYFQISTLQT